MSKNLYPVFWKGGSIMRASIILSFTSLLTGIGIGFLFALLRLPVPAPPTIPAVFGIVGITVGYLLFQRLFGSP